MRAGLKGVVFVAALVPLGGCVSHNWAAGPGMSMVNFEADSAKCRLFGRANVPSFGFEASGSPKFVASAAAGAALGSAIGSAIHQNADYNDCMQARGWRVADNVAPVAPAASVQAPVYAATPAQAVVVQPLAPTPVRAPVGGDPALKGFAVEPMTTAPVATPRRGLGVRTAQVTEMGAYSSRIDPPRGLVITSVLRGQAASSAGLLPGDVILAFGTAPLMTVDDLQRGLADVIANSVVEAQVWRDEHEMTVRFQF